MWIYCRLKLFLHITPSKNCQTLWEFYRSSLKDGRLLLSVIFCVGDSLRCYKFLLADSPSAPNVGSNERTDNASCRHVWHPQSLRILQTLPASFRAYASLPRLHPAARQHNCETGWNYPMLQKHEKIADDILLKLRCFPQDEIVECPSSPQISQTSKQK